MIIVDTFEKVRAIDFRQTEEMQQAIETIFIQDWKLLQLPCHVIYTVPTWLTFCDFGTSAQFGQVCILPMCRLMNHSSGKREDEGFAAMREILKKRMDLAQLFADTKPLDDLIEASGGYPRDFLRMTREVFLSAIMEKITPPIPSVALSRLVGKVIDDQIRNYDKPIYDEDLPLLVEVARTHNVPRTQQKDVFRIAELFDNHFVLGYRNGQEWYDLHPLVRRSPRVQAALGNAH